MHNILNMTNIFSTLNKINFKRTHFMKKEKPKECLIVRREKFLSKTNYNVN